MTRTTFSVTVVILLLLLFTSSSSFNELNFSFTHAYPVTLLNATTGVYDMGVAVDKGNTRGVVVTVCGQAPNPQYECILALMMEFSSYMFALLVVNSENGNTTRLDFPNQAITTGDAVYASLLSFDGQYYYFHFGGHFFQFDAKTVAFSFIGKTLPGTAMRMTLDNQGNVWSVTYPKSGLVSFNPNTRVLTDYGYVYNQSWPMYQRSLAFDDQGYLYFAVGYTLSQIIAFNPNTSKANPLIPEHERVDGMPVLYRDVDGAVYAANVHATPVYRLYKGNSSVIVSHPKVEMKYITGSQDFFYPYFPSLRRLITFDEENRQFTIREKNNTLTTLSFQYTCRGANIMDIRASPDFSTLIGGSNFPMNFFTMNSKNGIFQNYYSVDQPNVVQAFPYDPYVWFGTYPYGRLLQYDLNKPWIDPIAGNVNSTNPVILTSAMPHIIRPSVVLVHPNKKFVFMGGTPEYGNTGGGLLIWNRLTQNSTVLDHTQLLKYHSTHSMAVIPNSQDLILCGTTIAAGTGGVPIAPVAELYIFNTTSMNVTWRGALISNVRYYYELFSVSSTGLIYGYTDSRMFFVFNPANRSLIHLKPMDRAFVEQGPHSFALHPNGRDVYITLSTGIHFIDENTFAMKRIMTPPSKVLPFNGVILKNGWYYYRSESRIHGFKLFNVTEPLVSNSVKPIGPSSRPEPARNVSAVISMGSSVKMGMRNGMTLISFISLVLFACWF
ncbi:hypothetical protein C9374_009437 [Naegleria lovaniensis]|uniref:Uncharacterized protein n=1 Tax=Naegleria lovaniensis TaxID=51637 RepID=A0AA88KWV6_NAELO|nr:uncharacterized protein C9374_009437 [Naegleria lovaniensis]KAG2392860.1 hypothetical protein C9374_009437 [Naegleria lovaniensis]